MSEKVNFNLCLYCISTEGLYFKKKTTTKKNSGVCLDFSTIQKVIVFQCDVCKRMFEWHWDKIHVFGKQLIHRKTRSYDIILLLLNVLYTCDGKAEFYRSHYSGL